MQSWWQEEPALSAEVCQILGRGDFRVYMDNPHRCYHIMLGNEEWTSVLLPWGEAARETLRRRAFIMHNDRSKEEAQIAKDSLEKSFADSEKEQHQLLEDIGKSIAKWGTRDHDYYIMP